MAPKEQAHQQTPSLGSRAYQPSRQWIGWSLCQRGCWRRGGEVGWVGGQWQNGLCCFIFHRKAEGKRDNTTETIISGGGTLVLEFKVVGNFPRIDPPFCWVLLCPTWCVNWSNFYDGSTIKSLPWQHFAQYWATVNVNQSIGPFF